MQNLISANEFQSSKDIGEKIDESKVNKVIEMAQSTNLKDALGSRFYFDLIANFSNTNYQDLLSGCSFTYSNVEYYQDGLKALLADYAMSKYVLAINTNFTPFGATVKQSDKSQPADRNSLKDISTQQLQLAGSRWETIKLYLDSNSSNFPNWINNVYDSSEHINSERKPRYKSF